VEALPIVDVFVDAVMERALGEQGEGVGGSASGAWSRAPTSGASRPRTLTVPSSSGTTRLVFIAAEIVGDSPPSRTIIQFFARELEQWRVRHGALPGAGAWLE